MLMFVYTFEIYRVTGLLAKPDSYNLFLYIGFIQHFHISSTRTDYAYDYTYSTFIFYF